MKKKQRRLFRFVAICGYLGLEILKDYKKQKRLFRNKLSFLWQSEVPGIRDSQVIKNDFRLFRNKLSFCSNLWLLFLSPEITD